MKQDYLGDSDFCNRYRGTRGLFGRFVLFLDRLWMRKVIGVVRNTKKEAP